MKWIITGLIVIMVTGSASAQPATPAGEIKGHAWQHTDVSLAAAVGQASVVLPATVAGGTVYAGTLAGVPVTTGKVPVVVFLHGSSGLGLKAIAEWQKWLASLGIASVAPDSFALADRVTYSSPISKADYEKIHAMRGAEITASLAALKTLSWVEQNRLILAGASEGGVAVARYNGAGFLGKIIYSWSCEANYFVETPANYFVPDQAVLNVMSTVDPFFSQSNSWLGNPAAKGHCGDALKDNKRGRILLIPGAPHTLMNLPAAKEATEAFLREVL